MHIITVMVHGTCATCGDASPPVTMQRSVLDSTSRTNGVLPCLCPPLSSSYTPFCLSLNFASVGLAGASKVSPLLMEAATPIWRFLTQGAHGEAARKSSPALAVGGPRTFAEEGLPCHHVAMVCCSYYKPEGSRRWRRGKGGRGLTQFRFDHSKPGDAVPHSTLPDSHSGFQRLHHLTLTPGPIRLQHLFACASQAASRTPGRRQDLAPA
jgi:hypothetical protein